MLQLRYSSLLACGVLAALTACNHEGQDEMSWARAALERNTAIEVVAADQKTHTFTVRDKATGAVSTIRADDVTAGPALTAATAAAAASATAPAATAAAATTAADSAASATSAAATSLPEEQAAAPEAAPTMHVQSSSLTPQGTAATEATPGRVLESGPGYSIKAANAGVTAGTPGASRDTGMTNAPLERRYEPIVCQGARLVHIDNRNLVFTGDAVSAQDGCEIHITNSHITATGIGVSARAANVHIDNSLIEGDQASIDASEGAQVYAASSHFKGLSRRLDSAAFHDLGGNIWN